MVELKQIRSPINKVDYSRYLGLPTLVAIGANISIGVGVYLLVGSVLQSLGSQAPFAYFLTIIFFTPLILTLVQHTLVAQGGSGMYNLTRASHDIRQGFSNGWLLMGGLVGLGALLAWGAATYLQYFLNLFFATNGDNTLLTLIVILLIAVNQFLGTHAAWRKRRLVVFTGLIILLFLLLLAWIKPIQALSGFAFLSTNNEIEAISLLAVGLWGMYFVLERTDRLKDSRQNVLPSILIPFILLAVTGIAASIVLLRYPSLVVTNRMPLVTLAAAYSPLLQLILVLLVFVMSLIGLNQVFTSLFLLAGDMTADGFLPPALTFVSPGRGVPEKMLLVMTGLVALTAVLFSVDVIVSMASVGLLASVFVIHIKDVTKKTSDLPPDRWPRLPLHPLFPIMVVVISLTLIFVQPLADLTAIALWGLVGIIYYLLYARRAGIIAMQQEVLVTDNQAARDQGMYRVLVCLSRPETAVSLIKAGALIAQARQGSLLVLNVLSVPDQIAEPQKQAFAHQALDALEGYIKQAALSPLQPNPHPLIRIAPSAAAGILETAWEENANAILLSWPNLVETPPGVVQEGVVEQIVRRAQQEVIVLRGELPETITTVLAPMTSEAHQDAALSLGAALAPADSGLVMAIQPVRERLTPSLQASYSRHLEEHIHNAADRGQVSGQVVQAANIQNALITASEQYDVMLIGMSGEGFLASTTFSGLPVDVAEQVSSPVLLVKSSERRERFWARIIWQNLTEWLPSVDKSQQAAVYLGARRDARATIDFYVLILLSTTIAYFGLLQSSSAVIIGAMLIAPLMSPILAMAHSIVQGNMKMLRQAADSTFKGVLLAIGTAVVFSFMLVALGFPITATSEILARTQPNILDLMVAIASGAAAAYAISRKEVASALPGVAIAAALVPPLAVVGYGIGSLRFDLSAGALLLFVTNLAAIILAGAVTFLLLGFRPSTRGERGEQTRYGLRMAVTAMIIITIPLLALTYISNVEARKRATIDNILLTNWPPSAAKVENITFSRERRNHLVDFTVYDFTGTIDTNDIISLQNEISATVDLDVILRSIIIQGNQDVVTGASTPVFTPTPTPSLTPTAAATPPPEG